MCPEQNRNSWVCGKTYHPSVNTSTYGDLQRGKPGIVVEIRRNLLDHHLTIFKFNKESQTTIFHYNYKAVINFQLYHSTNRLHYYYNYYYQRTTMSLFLPSNVQPLAPAADLQSWDDRTTAGLDNAEFFQMPKGMEDRSVQLDYTQL